MRRNAGRSMEYVIVLAFVLALSLLGGWAWKPWGYFAGPAALFALVAVGIMGTLISEARKKKS
jgi:hypothetical protein